MASVAPWAMFIIFSPVWCITPPACSLLSWHDCLHDSAASRALLTSSSFLTFTLQPNYWGINAIARRAWNLPEPVPQPDQPETSCQIDVPYLLSLSFRLRCRSFGKGMIWIWSPGGDFICRGQSTNDETCRTYHTHWWGSVLELFLGSKIGRPGLGHSTEAWASEPGI